MRHPTRAIHQRAAVMDRLQNELVPKWKSLGMLGKVIVTQSNLNDATQIQQIRQLVDQGVDAIIVCCSNRLLMHLLNMLTIKVLRYFRALDI